MSENFESVEYSKVMRNSFVDYALSVIIDRALPDIRDGLKPVQRRILYDMFDLKILPDKQHRKCGRIVGDTMGRFHPHGDSSIYEALVRMSQNFKLNNPLIDIHGNNGSVDGDPAAASRYTEAKLSQFGYEMVKDINPNIVNFIDNYDGTEKEPAILPALIPNLFLMGANGLAVGMRTDIPPHNLSELIDGIIAYMGNKKITLKELLKHTKGPDFPTGGIIINKKDLIELYKTGTGKVIIQSKINVEPGTYGKTNLVITEIPYTFSGNKLKLIESLITLMKDKKLDEISEIRDESSKDIRIILEVKKGVNVEKLLKKLYAKTKLQDTMSCNLLVVKDTVPMQIGLKDYFKEYLEFQREIYTNKYRLYLSKAERELEILNGLCIAYDQIDAVIETVRYSKNLTTAKRCLTTGNVSDVNFKTKKNMTIAKKFQFTELQAQTILDMKLQRLNGLEINAIVKNKEKCEKEISTYTKILNSKTMLNNIIKKDLLALKEKYGEKRKTKIIDKTETFIEEKPEIINEEILVIIDRFNYIKAIDRNAKIPEDMLDVIKNKFKINSIDEISIFTDCGNLYHLKVSEIPRTKIREKGVLLSRICKMRENEKILFISSSNKLNDLLFVFSDGYMKRVNSEEFKSRYRKIVATKLYNNSLIAVANITSEKKLEIIGEKKTHMVKISDIPLVNKNIKGNKLIKDKVKNILLT